MSRVEIAVSPFYSGNGWTDRGTGIEFVPQTSGQLKTKSFNLSDKEDLTGIKNSVRLNHLILLSGDLNDVADEPQKINPEELTGEDLDQLINSKGNNNDKLIKENKALKNRIKELEKKLEKQKTTIVKVDRKAMEEDNTKKELLEIAKKEKVEIDSSSTKKEIVNKIADNREK